MTVDDIDSSARFVMLPAICSTQDLPTGDQRVFPFGWDVAAVPSGRDGELRLSWPDAETAATGESRLRITVARDIRTTATIEVLLAESRQRLGTIDVRYGSLFDPVELALSATDAAAVLREGAALRCSEPEPVWIFAGPQAPTSTGPHLLVGPTTQASTASRWPAAYDLLASTASMQPLGWQEGCALEGLEALATADPSRRSTIEDAISARLALYFDSRHVRYIDPRGRPVTDDWKNNVENGLMGPSLMRYLPEHPSLAQFVGSATRRAQSERVDPARRELTAEGSYTLAYPLAVLAQQREDRYLASLAISSLIARLDRLRGPDGLYLRRHADGTTTMSNWLRGAAWLTLGTSRTLEVLAPVVPRMSEVEWIRRELREVLVWLLHHQRPDGLWNCYVDAPETGVETSGSAGVATALVIASELGVIGAEAIAAARRCAAGVQEHLTGDGMLGGVSQLNKAEAGEALQRGGHRIRSHMGLGLAVQLSARLESVERGH